MTTDDPYGPRAREIAERRAAEDRGLLARLRASGRVLRRDVTRSPEPSEALQDTLINVYRTDSKNAEMCERLVDLDEGIQEWRYRHVKMVERTIGAKIGTGGSAGAEYLRNTVGRNLFPDLWEIRSRL